MRLFRGYIKFRLFLFLVRMAILATVALAGCGALRGIDVPGTGLSGTSAHGIFTHATHPVDGDTLKVATSTGRQITVRVLGIDSPESHKPGTPVECGANAASAKLAQMVGLPVSGYGPGRPVWLEFDPHGERTDRYGRTLAYVHVRSAHGPTIEAAQLRAGLAEPYYYDGRLLEYAGVYNRLARQAKQARRGVWGACGGDFHSADPNRR